MNQQEILNDYFTKKEEIQETDKYKNLYRAANNILAKLSVEEEIYLDDPLVMAVMDALHEIDGGTYNEKI